MLFKVLKRLRANHFIFRLLSASTHKTQIVSPVIIRDKKRVCISFSSFYFFWIILFPISFCSVILFCFLIFSNKIFEKNIRVQNWRIFLTSYSEIFSRNFPQFVNGRIHGRKHWVQLTRNFKFDFAWTLNASAFKTGQWFFPTKNQRKKRQWFSRENYANFPSRRSCQQTKQLKQCLEAENLIDNKKN